MAVSNPVDRGDFGGINRFGLTASDAIVSASPQPFPGAFSGPLATIRSLRNSLSAIREERNSGHQG